MKIDFTDEQHMRIIEILEDDLIAKQRKANLRGANRIEIGMMVELEELIAVLWSAKKSND